MEDCPLFCGMIRMAEGGCVGGQGRGSGVLFFLMAVLKVLPLGLQRTAVFFSSEYFL